MEGTGVKTWPDKTKYVGEFKNGQANGEGVKTMPNGFELKGTFIDGKYSGDAIAYPNGVTYSGDNTDGMPNGKG